MCLSVSDHFKEVDMLTFTILSYRLPSCNPIMRRINLRLFLLSLPSCLSPVRQQQKTQKDRPKRQWPCRDDVLSVTRIHSHIRVLRALCVQILKARLGSLEVLARAPEGEHFKKVLTGH